MNIHEVGRGGVMVRKLESQENPFSKYLAVVSKLGQFQSITLYSILLQFTQPVYK